MATTSLRLAKAPRERLAAAGRCRGVQLAATHGSVRAPSVVAQHADALVLMPLGLPTAAIDWPIAITWALPAWIPAVAACLVAALIVTTLARPSVTASPPAAACAALYELPRGG